jgi:hypothetical protein
MNFCVCIFCVKSITNKCVKGNPFAATENYKNYSAEMFKFTGKFNFSKYKPIKIFTNCNFQLSVSIFVVTKSLNWSLR